MPPAAFVSDAWTITRIGQTQRQIGEALGVTQQAVSGWIQEMPDSAELVITESLLRDALAS